MQTEPATDFTAIYGLFALASRNLKYPRVRLQTESGDTVIIKLAGNQSKYTGQLQVTDDKPYGENKYFGRIDSNGAYIRSWSASPEVTSLLEKLSDNPAKVASEYGRMTGRCCFCGLQLSDERSTAVGYGEICAEHYGLPWSSEKFSFANIPAPPECFHPGTVEALLADISTPFWAKDVIRVAVEKE